jgi:hypothetical protein
VYDTDLDSFSHWNGSFWVGLPVTTEDFVFPSGDTITFTGFSANGGTAAFVSAVGFAEVADLNSATTKARYGEFQTSISNLANGFCSTVNTSAANSARYQLSLRGSFYVGGVWRQVTAQIDFANNPALACFGLLTFSATTTVNPLTGIYHRLPRIGETAFVKYVVREGGVENINDTAIPFTTNLTGYLKTGLLWDGMNDTMHFITGANGVYDIKSVATFSVSHPSAFAALHHFGSHTIRNGSGAVMATVTMRKDKVERYIFSNYIDYI